MTDVTQTFNSVELAIAQGSLCRIPHLSDYLSDEEHNSKYDNAIIAISSGAQYNKLLDESDIIVGDIKRNRDSSTSSSPVKCYLRAGPRATCFFNPAQCKMAVVTCGGLCPGLNAVIYGIVNAAKDLYNVPEVWGIRGGFHGFYNWTDEDDPSAPVLLTDKIIRGLQHKGEYDE